MGMNTDQTMLKKPEMGLYAELFHFASGSEDESSNSITYRTAPLCYFGWSLGLILVGLLISGFFLEFKEMANILARDTSVISNALYFVVLLSGPVYLVFGLLLLGMGKKLAIHPNVGDTIPADKGVNWQITKTLACYGVTLKKKTYPINSFEDLEITPTRIIEDGKGNSIKQGPWSLWLRRKDQENILLDRHLSAKPLEEIRKGLTTCLQH